MQRSVIREAECRGCPRRPSVRRGIHHGSRGEGVNMPEKKTIERARKARREGKAPSTQAGEFVREEIEHIREGKHGARSAKQAIAIGLSKARRAGVDLPPPEPGQAKRSTRRKAKQDLEKGKSHRKVSLKRARATHRALEREGRAAASHTALSRQARGQGADHAGWRVRARGDRAHSRGQARREIHAPGDRHRVVEGEAGRCAARSAGEA